MKTWIIKTIGAALLFGFVFTGCTEPRYYERGSDNRHHQRERHDDNNHHDNDHHDD